MQEKENVITENNQTEQGSTIEQEAFLGSADLGKFKDVNALLMAYRALQAEFTRRSQRLKRYEELENQARKALPSQAAEKELDTQTPRTDLVGGASAEELPLPDAAQALDAAVGNVVDAPVAKDARPDSAKEEEIEKDTDENPLETVASADGAIENDADGQSNAKRESAVEQPALSLYEQVMQDEEVRLRIIGDYLASIGKSNAPLVRGGAGMLATPPKKSRTVADAGNMALAYLKAHRSQV
jgi:hypothetical protein